MKSRLALTCVELFNPLVPCVATALMLQLTITMCSPPKTASGPCRARTILPPASARSRRSRRANATRLRPVLTFSTGVLGGPRGPAAGGGQHHVRGDALAQRPLRLRPHQGRLSAPLEVPARREPQGGRHRLLRRGESRRGLRRRQDRLQPARRAHGRRRREDRPRDLEDQGRGPRSRRDHHHGAAGGEGPGAGRSLGRRVRHSRLVQGARSRDRQDRLDRAQHRPRQRHAGAARHVQSLLRQGHGPRQSRPGRRHLAARRRAGLGLALLRRRAGPGLLRHRQPGPVQRRAAAGRQQVDQQCARAASRATARWSGPTSSPRRQLGLRRQRRDDPRRPHDRRAAPEGAGAVQQERLRLHARPRDRRGAGGRAVRRGELGEARGPRRTGRPVLDSTKLTGKSRGNVKGICPSLEGGKSPASPASYSPRDRAILYVDEQPLHELAVDESDVHSAARRTSAPTSPTCPGPAGISARSSRGTRRSGKKVWEIKEKFPVWSGTLATAGDVVFYGTLDGWFKAVDAQTGKPLWKFKVGSGVVGAPITTAGRTGNSTSRCTRASAATGSCSRATCAPTIPPTCGAARLHARPRPPHEPGGIVWIFGL